MSLHFEARSSGSVSVAGLVRKDRGRRAYLSGLAAEMAVVSSYRSLGCQIENQRWRGEGGEIDLIVRDDDTYVFVEVKRARDFDAAAKRLSLKQAKRIHMAAAEYLARAPVGLLSDVRFDLALCNGVGNVKICQGAFSYF